MVHHSSSSDFDHFDPASLLQNRLPPAKRFYSGYGTRAAAVVLAAHPSLGVNSVAELVALAKIKPGLAYATSGAGTQQHIAAEWFANLAGIKLTHVPYKGGGQAITDFIGGQVPLASLGAAPLVPHYRSGRAKLLAQTVHTRSPNLPDVPTLEESGFKGLVIEQWQGVFLPPRRRRRLWGASMLKS